VADGLTVDDGTFNSQYLEITMNMIARFANDESGATAIEYGLIAALISVAIIVVLTNIGADLNGVFTKIETNLKKVSG
jgi:pilus assembly protein Flp/PilA